MEDFISGHESIGKRVNIRKELARIRLDPLQPLLKALGVDESVVLSTDISRYQEAYWFYFLAMTRYLQNMSVTVRFQQGAYWVRRSGGKYTPYQKKIAEKYKAMRPYLEFDMANCLIHTRILLDRVASLSRTFLDINPKPSFTSFSDHKKFFERHTNTLPNHEEYACYIRSETDWFDMPLKTVRDKFLVHASPKHMRFMGLPNAHEVELSILLPVGNNPEKPLERMKVIRVNAVRLSYDIEHFLEWFCAYGLKALTVPNHGVVPDAANGAAPHTP